MGETPALNAGSPSTTCLEVDMHGPGDFLFNLHNHGKMNALSRDFRVSGVWGHARILYVNSYDRLMPHCRASAIM